MDQIREHFESEAKEFDAIIIKIIPFYDQMIGALIDSIHFNNDSAISIIDLGCGTGMLAKRISEKYPNSKIVCLDIASNMIDIAKQKLSKHKNTEFITGDFSMIDSDNRFTSKTSINWCIFVISFAIAAIVVLLTVFIHSYKASHFNTIEALRRDPFTLKS